MNLTNKPTNNEITKEYIDHNLKQLYTATQRNINQAIQEIQKNTQTNTTNPDNLKQITETLKKTQETITKIEQQIEQIKKDYLPVTRFENMKELLTKEFAEIHTDLNNTIETKRMQRAIAREAKNKESSHEQAKN